MRVKKNIENARLRILYRKGTYIFSPEHFMRGYRGKKSWETAASAMKKEMLLSSFHDDTTNMVITCHAMALFDRENE